MRTRGRHGFRRSGRRIALTASVLGLLVAALCAGPAAAFDVRLSADRWFPQIGEEVRFDVQTSDAAEIRIQVDNGPMEAPSFGRFSQLTRAFSAAGSHVVRAKARDQRGQEASREIGITVVEPLEAQVVRSPENPTVGETVTFTASSSGGRSPHSYEWDFTSDGATDATGTTVTTTFGEAAAYVTKLTVKDSANPVHSSIAEVTTTVQPLASPPPESSSCSRSLTFGVVHITADDCLTATSNAKQYFLAFGTGIKLNGVPISRNGQITIDVPSTANNFVGRLQADGTEIKVGNLVAFRGNLDLQLPGSGRRATERLGALSVPSNTELFGLAVDGTFEMLLGIDAQGKRYADLPLRVSLPDPIRNGPPKIRPTDRAPGRVTTTATLRVNPSKVLYEGLVLRTPLAWIADLPVGSLCYSYIGSGVGQSELCQPPTVDAKPYLECSAPVTSHRWSGVGDLELPTSTKPRLTAFSSTSNGKIVSFGGLVDNFGGPSVLKPLKIIEPGFDLNRIGFGLCLGDPLTIRGDVGAAFFANRVTTAPLEIDGKLLFTGGTATRGWKFEISGKVSAFTHKVGDATATLRAGGHIDLSVDAGLNIKDTIKLNGRIDGWIDTAYRTYSISGKIRGCVSAICGSAEALVTSVGAAACVDGGSITVYTIKKKSNWKWWAPWRVKTVETKIKLEAGAGYRWASGQMSIAGGECGFGPYKVASSVARRAAGGGERAIAISSGVDAVALRVAGTSGPPKVRVRGPGFDVSSPADARSASAHGRYMLIEDDGAKATHVILVNPKPGTYVITGLDPANPIGRIDRATADTPFSSTARVTKASKGRRVLRMSYVVPEGASLRLVERGRGVQSTIVAKARGKRCRGPKIGVRLLCLDQRFKPARGPGGRRSVEAIVERNGVPIDTKPVVSYTLPARKPVAKPRIRLSRSGSVVRISWLPAAGAASYAISAKLADGRSLTFRGGRDCRTVHIRGVGRDVRVSARVVGLRSDLRPGRTAAATLRGDKRAAGSSKVRERRSCAT